MIEHLDIKNVALIKSGEVDFIKGLNIISGETGAGKSMVINSVKFLLGARAGKDFVRQGEEKAVVTGLFSLENEELRAKVVEYGISVEEDNNLLIERSLNESGKSTIKLNGKTVTLAILKEISPYLVDIHGQHDHQSLLNQAKHMEILDAFCPVEIFALKKTLSDYLREYKELSKKAAEITAKSGKAGERLERLKSEIDEIEKASLQMGEEDELHERQKTLQLSEKLRENAAKIIGLMDGDGDGILSAINQALRLVLENVSIDKEAAVLHEQLESISISLGEFSRDLSAYGDSIDSSGYELSQVEARMEFIYMLKRKYGSTVEEILAYCEKAKEDYEIYTDADDMLKKINIRRKELNKKITEVCNALHKLRSEQAKIIEGQIEDVLKELEMKDAKFEVSVLQKTQVGPNGNDSVVFLISPNLGEEPKELAKIASGGEMSRLMLALKSVISNADSVGTFIFDEIDAGVSGRTAQKVAQKLDFIGKVQQIICITHLPQIAAMADNHILIEKISGGKRTETIIKNLDRNEEANEIARLLGGVKITAATLSNAKELKVLAGEYKVSS